MISGHPYHFQSLPSKTGHCSVSFCGLSRPASLCLRQIWPSADLSLSVSACYIARGFQRQGMQQCRGFGGGTWLVCCGEGGGFCTITSLTYHCGLFSLFFKGGGGGGGIEKTILNRNVSLKALKWLGNSAGSPSNPSNGSVPTIWGCPCEPLDGRATTWLWLNVGISHVSETGTDVNHLLVVITLAQLLVYNHLGQNVSNFNLYLAPGMRRGRLWLH